MHTIKIDKPDNFEQKFKEAIKESTSRAITFRGDEKSGYASGYGFEGKYIVDDCTITITILRKPMIYSMDRIKAVIQSYLNDPKKE